MRLILLASLLFIFQLSVFSQTKKQRLLENIELRRFEAMTKKDIGFLQNVLSDDLTYTHSNGLFETKTVHLDNIRSGNLIYKTMQPESMKIQVYGKTAVITGFVNVTGLLKDKEFNLRLRYTDVYVRKKGKWKLVAWQSLKIE